MGCGDFGKTFERNMNALGLPAPSSLFGSLQAATSNIAAMLTALKTLGPNATIAELIGATTALAGLTAIGALSAAYYMGACIGSLIVATDATVRCTSAAKVVSTVHTWSARNGLTIPDTMYTLIRRHPEVMLDIPSRRRYAFLASRQRVAG